VPDRDIGESLTFEQSQERLRELTERGLWQVGSHIPGRAFTDVYRRSDAYYLIHEGPTNSYGLQTMRRDLPATVVARSEPMAALGGALMSMLDALDLRPEVPVKTYRFPVLRQAKARSWLDLIKTSAAAHVVRLGGIFAVGTWVRDR
jgi:hypothetical protein